MSKVTNDAMLFQHIHSRSGCFEWLAETMPITLRYCLKHNMDYRLVAADPNGYDGRNGHWTVPALIYEYLKLGYRYVIYLDADTVIMKSNVDLRDACQPDKIGAVWHNLSYHDPDWSHFNVGALYVENTPKVLEFVREWNRKFPGRADFPWWEQGEFNKLGRKMGIIEHLDNKWNAGHVSPSAEPVVLGLHGIPERLEAIRNAVKGLSHVAE